MTHFEKIKYGSENDIVDELEAAIKWARGLNVRDWNLINKSRDGLRGFIRKCMEEQV
jgi:hypothetical protein